MSGRGAQPPAAAPSAALGAAASAGAPALAAAGAAAASGGGGGSAGPVSGGPVLLSEVSRQLDGFARQLERFDETLLALQGLAGGGASAGSAPDGGKGATAGAGRDAANALAPGSGGGAGAGAGGKGPVAPYLDLNLIAPIVEVQRFASAQALELAARRSRAAPPPSSPRGADGKRDGRDGGRAQRWLASPGAWARPRIAPAPAEGAGDEAIAPLAELWLRAEALREGAEGLQRAARQIRQLELRQLLPGYEPPPPPKTGWVKVIDTLLAGGQLAPATDKGKGAEAAADRLRGQLRRLFTAEVEAAGDARPAPGRTADSGGAGGNAGGSSWTELLGNATNLAALSRSATGALEAVLARWPSDDSS